MKVRSVRRLGLLLVAAVLSLPVVSEALPLSPAAGAVQNGSRKASKAQKKAQKAQKKAGKAERKQAKRAARKAAKGANVQR